MLYHAPRNLNTCLSNRVGIIVPGERVPANSGNVVAFRDRVAVAPDEQELGERSSHAYGTLTGLLKMSMHFYVVALQETVGHVAYQKASINETCSSDCSGRQVF